MLKRTAIILGVPLASLLLLHVTAGRSVGEFLGLVQSTAGVTLESFENAIPDAIHDEAIRVQLAKANRELIDAETALRLSESKVADMRAEAQRLQATLARRERILADAHPVLHEAVSSNRQTVKFAHKKYAIADFEAFLDELMGEQEQQTNELASLETALQSMSDSQAACRSALDERRSALAQLQREAETLIRMRDLAKFEQQTNALVQTVHATPGTTSSVAGKLIEKLNEEVRLIQAQNEACRAATTGTSSAGASRLVRDYTRLEELEKYTDRDARGSASLSGPLSAAEGWE